MADQHVRRELPRLPKWFASRKREVLVDVVLVISGTGSMVPLFDAVKESALSFYNRVTDGLANKQRRVEHMRLKVIVYRDIYCDEMPFEESPFFELPGEAADFRRFLENVEVQGGGDKPQSGLEALWKAFRADFQSNERGKKARQIICLVTDASAHPLETPKRLGCSNYPNGVPADLLCLEDEWDGLDPHAKLLLIFAPMAFPWTELQNWDRVYFTPSASGMGGINADTYEGILVMIKDSI